MTEAPRPTKAAYTLPPAQPLTFFETHSLVPKPAVVDRPVDPDWQCQRSGECCRSVPYVIMTPQEADVLVAYAKSAWPIVKLANLSFFRAGNFAGLRAKPCPFLEGENICTVHEIRPYNCRRFGCLRPDVKAEPLETEDQTDPSKFGLFGCVNLRERLVKSRVARKIIRLLQQRGQRWARKHGWTNNAARA